MDCVGAGRRTEFVSPDGTSTFGPDLPNEIKSHCLIKMDEDNVLLTGGYDENDKVNETWYFNTIKNTWTPGPSMVYSRVYHACAAVQIHGTKVLMVAGNTYGEDSNAVEILIENSSSWIPGPSLPNTYLDFLGHKLVSNGEALYYLNTVTNLIFHLECESIDSCKWVELEQKLDMGPRQEAIAVFIDDDLADCYEK